MSAYRRSVPIAVLVRRFIDSVRVPEHPVASFERNFFPPKVPRVEHTEAPAKGPLVVCNTDVAARHRGPWRLNSCVPLAPEACCEATTVAPAMLPLSTPTRAEPICPALVLVPLKPRAAFGPKVGCRLCFEGVPLQRRMTAAILRHGGTLDKSNGDGIMASFGTPEPAPDDAARALCCFIESAGSCDGGRHQRKTRAAARGPFSTQTG